MTKPILKRELKLATLIAVLLPLLGCQSTYYKTMETFGYHKRDLMVKRVQDARDAEEEAKEQFESALEKFSSVLQFDGGELEEKYKQLKAEYDESESKAEAVRDRIDAVEDVAEALFDEWEAELDQYTNDRLRRSSERKLKETQRQYSKLINAMKRAEKKIDPVLLAFRDQVLFLKHNLNAQAIASLKSELVSVEANVASLIKEMEASIVEADAFISAMAKE
jgi:Skp family chaperone for outer membrane proteins